MPIKWNPMGDGGDGLQKWPMSAISKGRRRENPITAYIPGTGGLDRANSPSALIRIDARKKPTLRINQSNRSIRRACDRFDEPPLTVMVSSTTEFSSIHPSI